MTATETLSYPVRRGLEAWNRLNSASGFVRTNEPHHGYYSRNPEALNWDSLRRSQAVTETQQRLSSVDRRDRGALEIAVYDATRAYYEYTDPFGAKTYA